MGGSQLATQILGPWDRAPKAGRLAYERFVASVLALLGGEASSQEVRSFSRYNPTHHGGACCKRCDIVSVLQSVPLSKQRLE